MVRYTMVQHEWFQFDFSGIHQRNDEKLRVVEEAEEADVDAKVWEIQKLKVFLQRWHSAWKWDKGKVVYINNIWVQWIIEGGGK